MLTVEEMRAWNIQPSVCMFWAPSHAKWLTTQAWEPVDCEEDSSDLISHTMAPQSDHAQGWKLGIFFSKCYGLGLDYLLSYLPY